MGVVFHFQTPTEVLQFEKGKQPETLSSAIRVCSRVTSDEVWPVVDQVHHSSVNICIPEQQGKILCLHSLWIRNIGRNKTWDSDAIILWDCKFPLTWNLAFMQFFFLLALQHFPPYKKQFGMYLHIYKLQMNPTPCFIVHCVIFHSLEGSGVMRGERKQRRGGQACPQSSHLPYILYQLSSLGPSERLNHKRVQSLGDILFSPSLNTLYHSPDPYNFSSSCIYNSSQP